MADKSLWNRVWYEEDELDLNFPVKTLSDWSKFRGYCRDCGCEVFGVDAVPCPDIYEFTLDERAPPIIQCESCGEKSTKKAERLLNMKTRR